ncbi:hypothetical protein NFJ02_21g46150 [Pycnococcus provasolii]
MASWLVQSVLCVSDFLKSSGVATSSGSPSASGGVASGAGSAPGASAPGASVGLDLVGGYGRVPVVSPNLTVNDKSTTLLPGDKPPGLESGLGGTMVMPGVVLSRRPNNVAAGAGGAGGGTGNAHLVGAKPQAGAHVHQLSAAAHKLGGSMRPTPANTKTNGVSAAAATQLTVSEHQNHARKGNSLQPIKMNRSTKKGAPVLISDVYDVAKKNKTATTPAPPPPPPPPVLLVDLTEDDEGAADPYHSEHNKENATPPPASQPAQATTQPSTKKRRRSEVERLQPFAWDPRKNRHPPGRAYGRGVAAARAAAEAHVPIDSAADEPADNCASPAGTTATQRRMSRRTPGGTPEDVIYREPRFARLLAMLAEDDVENDELQVLHLKDFLPTDAGACVLLRVLDALSGKRAVQVLYMQAFGLGMCDAVLDRLVEVLKEGTIWALNVGDYPDQVTVGAWRRMADAIPQTNVTHLYAMDDGLWAQHPDVKGAMREHIRANRSKDARHVTEVDVVPRVTHMWFNPKAHSSEYKARISAKRMN